MSRGKKSGGSTVLFVILVTAGLLMFFGVISFNTRDFNDLVNLIRELWKGFFGT